MAIIKNCTITSTGDDVKKKEFSYFIAGNVNWCIHYGKQHGDLQKIKNIKLPYDSEIPLLSTYPNKIKILLEIIYTPQCSWQDYLQ